MKRVALITLHNVNNYGSVLQAYATQCYFEDLGLDSIIIDYRRPWETKIGYWFYLNDKSIKGVARNLLYFPSKVLQISIFGNFRKKYLKLTEKTYVSAAQLRDDLVPADIYCTGSDQVWNSGWNGGIIPEYFLDFVDVDNKKKISFAASFGNSTISSRERAAIKPLLKSYDLITVREMQSAVMLQKEMNLKAYEILDPTLQMDGRFWRKICKPERILKEKYVLLIQLNRNRTFDDLAVSFAHEKNLRLIRLCLRVDQLVLPGKCILIPKVEDYIRLIRDSEYVLTDSFHAVSFCLNLEKQFYVYYPKLYSERLKSILSLMKISHRDLNDIISNDNIEYGEIRTILESERNRSRQMFREVIANG